MEKYVFYKIREIKYLMFTHEYMNNRKNKNRIKLKQINLIKNGIIVGVKTFGDDFILISRDTDLIILSICPNKLLWLSINKNYFFLHRSSSFSRKVTYILIIFDSYIQNF